MKRLLFILILTFSFQSWTNAETYSCSYKWNDEIRTTVAKRNNNKVKKVKAKKSTVLPLNQTMSLRKLKKIIR